MTDDRFDRELGARLRAYESRLPGSDPSLSETPSRPPSWPMIGGGALVAAASVLAAVVLLGELRGGIGPSSSPGPGLSALPSYSADADWGPLAVIEGTGDEARNEGTLVVTGECVFLERDGERTLLVWPAAQVRWNADDDSISFSTLRQGVLALRSGDYVVLGGGGSSADEGYLSGAAWADSIDWVHRPADACLLDARWFVTDVASIGAPTPTLEPSAVAWVPLPIPEASRPVASLNGVTEWNGRLLAAGRADETRGAIWWSDDGATWQQATVPGSPPDRMVHVQTPFAVGDRLFAIGITAIPAGSGPVGSVIWSSMDGVTWTDTPASAEFETHPVRVVAVREQTVVAVEGHETATGSAFWVTSDGGATWQQAPLATDGWWAHHGLVDRDTLYAVGQSFEGSDSAAVVWTSVDALRWDRTELGPGRALRIARLPDGTLLVIGDDGDAPMGWTSPDGREWARSAIDLGCCGTAFAITPSGFVTVQGAADGSGSVVAVSSDGLTWSVTGPLAGEMRDVAWTKTFGVVIHGLDPKGRPAIVVGWESN